MYNEIADFANTNALALLLKPVNPTPLNIRSDHSKEILIGAQRSCGADKLISEYA